MAFIKNHLKQRIFTKNISEKIKIPPMKSNKYSESQNTVNLKIQGISKKKIVISNTKSSEFNSNSYKDWKNNFINYPFLKIPNGKSI